MPYRSDNSTAESFKPGGCVVTPRASATRVLARVAALALAGLFTAGAAGPAADRPEAAALEPTMTVYEQGLKNGWQDRGWSRRDLTPGQPARIYLEDNGGWMLTPPSSQSGYDVIGLRFRGPPGVDNALLLGLLTAEGRELGWQRLDETVCEAQADDWREALVPVTVFGGPSRRFDRLVIRVENGLGPEAVQIDHVVFYRKRDPNAPRPAVDKIDNRAPSLQPAPKADRSAVLVATCNGASHPISPLVYGIAYSPMNDAKDAYQWELGATARRWGGNPASRFNWKLGNAWNAASDWFYENVNYTGDPAFNWTRFLDANAAHGAGTALTLPILGWVAKDVGSYSFPVSVFGPQAQVDPYQSDAGNGMSRSGTTIQPQAPTRTSVPMTPEDIAGWVKAIKKHGEGRKRSSVDLYILDNEPMLWSSTHRDVHPDPLGYDELLERTIRYATAVKRADPTARIAGPAEWGWTNYFYSAIDAKAGFFAKPDRRAHGDLPLLAWYLKSLRQHEATTGKRLLDVLDVHFYPQGEGIYSPRIDGDASMRRVRSTRALWDPTYVDESWIKEPIELLPRLSRLVDEYYPGTRISIGEYNFGAEKNISGGLALAEALGRFTQTPALEAAFYWSYPPKNSPAFWAFRAFRNYDDKGESFRDISIPTKAPAPTSFFASRDDKGEHVVAIALNLDGRDTVAATTRLEGCKPIVSRRVFRYTATMPALTALPEGDPSADVLPPWSITVYEWTLGSPVVSTP